MEKCKCQSIKNFKNIEDTPFFLMPKREMIYPQKYYMLCKECYHVTPFILEDGIYKNMSKEEEKKE